MTADDLGAQAITRLGVAATPITAESVSSWPSAPGLYAVYSSADVWRTLQLGDPPDGRPLYVGKAERSLSSRELGTHFGFDVTGASSITGRSTLRRTLAALLRTPLGFRGRYRNPAKPDKPTHFGLPPDQDTVLSSWMRTNLLATYWEMPNVAVPLAQVEKAVLTRLQPPLNIVHVQHRWKVLVRHARAVMAADCSRS